MATVHRHARDATTWRRRVRAPPVREIVVPIPGIPTSGDIDWPMRKWAEWANAVINKPDIMERAQQLAQQQMAQSHQIINTAPTPFSLAIGAIAPDEVDLPLQAQLEQLYWRHLLLELGQALSMVGEHEAGARVLGALAHRFTIDPSNRRAAAAAAAPEAAASPQARHFEREVFTCWATPIQAGRLGPDPEASILALYKLAVKRGLWKTHLQRPLDHFDPSLKRKPFWHSSELPAAMALEGAFADIRAECIALMNSGDRERTFAKYHSRVVKAGGWSDVQFYAGCKRDQQHCSLCPKTAAIIAAQPRINSVIFGSHFFSRLVPGTHLSAHCGPSNFRLRCHLGLICPPNVRIRVGNEAREWKEGECLIFDDSFEHEVWHDGDSDRVVLICDLWHPDLDLQRTIEPLLNESQLQAMRAAMAQQHIKLAERTYSTGASVSRVGGD